MVLTMNIAAHGDRAVDGLDVAFLGKDLARLVAQALDLVLRQGLAALGEQLVHEAIEIAIGELLRRRRGGRGRGGGHGCRGRGGGGGGAGGGNGRGGLIARRHGWSSRGRVVLARRLFRRGAAAGSALLAGVARRQDENR